MPHFDMYKLLCYFHLLVCLHNNGCVMTEKASFLCSFDLHVIFAPFLSHDAQNMNKLRQLIFLSLLRL